MSSEQKINDENISPEGSKSKPGTPNRRTSGSSPFQILRNFASLSNRGSPSSPLGRLFRKVGIFLLRNNLILLLTQCENYGNLRSFIHYHAFLAKIS